MASPNLKGSDEYPIIPVYLYTGLEIIISVFLFTLTRAPLDISLSLPQVALYPHLSIALVPVLLLLIKRWGSRLTFSGLHGGSDSGFICKEKFLEEHEEIMYHTAVGDDERSGAAVASDHERSNESAIGDGHPEKKKTSKNKTVSYAADDDSLNMQRSDLAVWPSLTPDPHANHRRHKRKGRSDWVPGFENESHGYVKERRTSGIVQVEIEPSSIPPPWELGNASARSRLR